MQNFINRLPTMYKAVAAFISLLIPFLTAIVTAFADGAVYAAEWTNIGIAFSALVAGTKAVYEARNRKVTY